MTDFLKVGAEGPQIDKSALRDAGRALLGSNPAPAVSSPSVQSNVTVSPNVEQPPTGDSTALPGVAAVNPAALLPAVPTAETVTTGPRTITAADEDLVELTIDGVKTVLPFGEAKKQMMLHGHYTKNMQQVRQQERTLQQRMQQIDQLQAEADQAGKLREIIADPAKYVQYARMDPVRAMQLAQAFGVTPQQAAQGQTGLQPAYVPGAPFGGQNANADEIVNFGELQQALGQGMGSLEQRFSQALEARATATLGQVEQAISQKINELEDAREVSHLRSGIQTQIGKHLELHPQLKAVPRIKELIQFEVAQMGPKTQLELETAIDAVTRGVADAMNAAYQQDQQAKVIAKAKLETQGIEPGRGALAPNTTIKPTGVESLGPVTSKDYFKNLARFAKASLS